MQTVLHGLLLTVVILIMLFGLVGAVLPLVPGLPLIFGGALLYGLITHFARIGAVTLVAMGLIAVVIQVADYLAAAWGAKKFGGGRWGIVGAIAGGLIGTILFNVPGLVIGTIGGATAGELASGKKLEASARTGLGALVGFLAGTLVRVSAAIVMIGIFIIAVASG